MEESNKNEKERGEEDELKNLDQTINNNSNRSQLKKQENKQIRWQNNKYKNK